uniref:Uncharacterized protein n=1 Tax=Anopheles culicifacies TaxID=139723 RepID=A0A182MUT3_9DIPT
MNINPQVDKQEAQAGRRKVGAYVLHNLYHQLLIDDKGIVHFMLQFRRNRQLYLTTRFCTYNRYSDCEGIQEQGVTIRYQVEIVVPKVLCRLILAAKRCRILKIHGAALILGVSDRARIRRVAVGRQAGIGFYLRLGTVRSLARSARHVLVSPERAVLQIFLITWGRIRIGSIQQRIVIELFGF